MKGRQAWYGGYWRAARALSGVGGTGFNGLDCICFFTRDFSGLREKGGLRGGGFERAAFGLKAAQLGRVASIRFS